MTGLEKEAGVVRGTSSESKGRMRERVSFSRFVFFMKSNATGLPSYLYRSKMPEALFRIIFLYKKIVDISTKK